MLCALCEVLNPDDSGSIFTKPVTRMFLIHRDTYMIKADRIFEGITCKPTPHEIKQLIS